MSKKAEIIGSHFPTIYLTVISLLQGIALSLLIPSIITYFELAEHPWSDVRLLALALMLLVIFIVWHHYAVGIFYLRWFPNIIDTIIPFMLGIGQFFLISFLTIKTSISEMDLDLWEKGFAIFLLSGSFPYFAAAIRIAPQYFINLMSMQDAIEHSQYIRKYYNWSGVITLFQGFFGLAVVLTHEDQLLWISLILMFGHLVLSEYFILMTIKPHFIEAMDDLDRKQNQK